MKIKELEKIIYNMRINYVKEHYKGSLDNLNEDDIMSIYVLMLTKERKKERC